MDAIRVTANNYKSAAEEIIRQEYPDFLHAKALAMRAQETCPEIEGISKLLATIDVYIAGQAKVGNEANWYGVLGVNPTDPDEVIKRQYKKLALSLHPDKNPSVGADGAFQLISEAWTVLSDKAKKAEYDKTISVIIKKVDPTMETADPQFTDYMGTTPASSTAPPPACANMPKPTRARKPPRDQVEKNFWTCCLHCGLCYEYPVMYVRKNLMCPSCKATFVAEKIKPPKGQRHKTTDEDVPLQNPPKENSAQPLGSELGSGAASTDSNNVGLNCNFDLFSWRSSASGSTGAEPYTTNQANTSFPFGNYASSPYKPFPNTTDSGGTSGPTSSASPADPTSTYHYSNFYPFFGESVEAGRSSYPSSSNYEQNSFEQRKRTHDESTATHDGSRSPKRVNRDDDTVGRGFDLNMPAMDDEGTETATASVSSCPESSNVFWQNP